MNPGTWAVDSGVRRLSLGSRCRHAGRPLRLRSRGRDPRGSTPSGGALPKEHIVSEKRHRPLELLRRLEEEHDEHYVYRGESRLFPPPMWPSKYRRLFASEGDVSIDREATIRGTGGRFFFRL